eukprot:437563-Pelagomonas_calceolata.AAC.1
MRVCSCEHAMIDEDMRIASTACAGAQRCWLRCVWRVQDGNLKPGELGAEYAWAMSNEVSEAKRSPREYNRQCVIMRGREDRDSTLDRQANKQAVHVSAQERKGITLWGRRLHGRDGSTAGNFSSALARVLARSIW